MNQTSIVSDPSYRMFELIYKKGGPAQKIHFRAKDLVAAVVLGKKYCDANNLHFVFVNPWEMDLSELLARKEELAKVG